MLILTMEGPSSQRRIRDFQWKTYRTKQRHRGTTRTVYKHADTGIVLLVTAVARDSNAIFPEQGGRRPETHMLVVVLSENAAVPTDLESGLERWWEAGQLLCRGGRPCRLSALPPLKHRQRAEAEQVDRYSGRGQLTGQKMDLLHPGTGNPVTASSAWLAKLNGRVWSMPGSGHLLDLTPEMQNSCRGLGTHTAEGIGDR